MRCFIEAISIKPVKDAMQHSDTGTTESGNGKELTNENVGTDQGESGLILSLTFGTMMNPHACLYQVMSPTNSANPDAAIKIDIRSTTNPDADPNNSSHAEIGNKTLHKYKYFNFN